MHTIAKIITQHISSVRFFLQILVEFVVLN